VPLTGPNAELGQSIANATQMALLDTNASTVRITTYDTSNGSAAAATRAMQDGNKLILGPLLASEIAPVAAVARAAKVPLITYSNDPGVAARDVFVMGSTPANSIQRVVEFARSKGVTRFALLAPKGDYGSRASAAYGAAVRATGGTLVMSESYDRANTSILSAARLKGAGVANPRILGTDLWSGDPVASSNASLRGAWFAALADTRFRQFTVSYKARFGVAPYRQATLGYDSVLLTVRIARDWRGNGPFPYAKLVDAGGFLGLDGPFRFASNGLGERALEVRETRAGGVTIVSPAPEKFAD
jgi:hypothetical protein